MKKDPMKITTHALLGMLILQYLFGMYASLFVHFPDTKNEVALWEFARVQWSVIIHIIIAAGLVLGGIVFLIRALRKKEKVWIIASSLGLFGLLIASFGGARFVPTQQGGYSYLMAVGFLLSFLSYGWGLYKAK
jgi:hypothetical protein